MQLTWTVRGEGVPEYTSPQGHIFKSVLTKVHWSLTATEEASDAENEGEGAVDKGVSVHRQDVVELPLPTNPETYVPLADLEGMAGEQRQATILAWAEAVAPGFKKEQEDAITAEFEEAKEAQAQTFVVSIV